MLASSFCDWGDYRSRRCFLDLSLLMLMIFFLNFASFLDFLTMQWLSFPCRELSLALRFVVVGGSRYMCFWILECGDRQSSEGAHRVE